MVIALQVYSMNTEIQIQVIIQVVTCTTAEQSPTPTTTLPDCIETHIARGCKSRHIRTLLLVSGTIHTMSSYSVLDFLSKGESQWAELERT